MFECILIHDPQLGSVLCGAVLVTTHSGPLEAHPDPFQIQDAVASVRIPWTYTT